jgi:hypothetical protein
MEEFRLILLKKQKSHSPDLLVQVIDKIIHFLIFSMHGDGDRCGSAGIQP